ncbi:T9SS type A sorting domain-containing protein [candidate division WOR-3 bacterium]|nr:T9SS type A sorting domain-containing protein [candidate division WOR-3 bacterium]
MKQIFVLAILCIFLFPIALLSQQGGTIVYGPKIQVNDPDPDSTLQNHPAVVIDDSLHIFVAWQDDRDEDGNYNIYFSKLENYQDTVFTPDISISDTLNPTLDEWFPRIAVDKDNIYIIWQGTTDGTSWKVYFSKSSDAGSTFTVPDTLPGITIFNSTTSSVNSGPQPKIAVDSKSSIDTTFIYVAWADDSSGALRVKLARSIDQAISFQDMGILDHNPDKVNRDPDIAVDSIGTLYSVWRWGTGGSNQDPHPWLGFNKSDDRGNTFLPNDVIFLDDTVSNVYRGNPKITINEGNENILITWEDCRRHGGNADPDIFFTRSTDGGSTFLTSAKRVNYIRSDTSGTYENYRAAISIDESGSMAVAWHSDPGDTGKYSIFMCAYDDSIQIFGQGAPLYATYTGNTPGTFGNNFYPPGLKVSLIDSVSHFFLVWKDLSEDPNGNIYYVLGWVVITVADLDIDNNALDVVNDTMNFGQAPAGPAYLKKHFRIVNTDTTDNPDSLDGPSLDSLVRIECPGVILYGPGGATIDSGFVSGLPSGLAVGQSAQLELTLFIPERTPQELYSGYVSIIGTDPDSGQTVDSFMVIIEGPEPEEDLDSLKVFPIPFKPSQGHTKIYFEGLTAEATVKIYDASGALVKTIEESGDDGLEDGFATWKPEENASGIYFYVITNPDGELKKGKLAIIK